MTIRIKRVYEKPAADDGYRVLIDRLWPRGLSKNKARVDLWLKDSAPSNALRKWFGHDPERWSEFKRRYFAELKENKELPDMILEKSRGGTITLVYGAKEERRNNAVALREYLLKNK